MKNYAFFLIISLFFLSCKEKKADNDWSKMELHGKVKTLVEKDYFLDTTGDNKGKHLRWTRTYNYHTNGLLTERTQLDDKGDPIFRFIYSYDAANRIKEERAIDDPQNHATSYLYDTVKHTILKNNSFKIGSDDSKSSLTYSMITLSQYDGTGQLLNEKDWMSVNSADTSVETFFYDKKLRKMKSVLKNSDIQQSTYYGYDEHGNCISEVADTALPHRAIKTIRRFDKQDNLTEETSYEADGSIHSQKKIEYKSFDKTGNWLVQYIHWKDLGTTVVERSIEYYP